jgi:SAM-dependent methyltransferase
MPLVAGALAPRPLLGTKVIALNQWLPSWALVTVARMIYQDPLAYLLGLEGAALLRGFAGEYNREFCEARIAEIRRLLDSPSLHGHGVTADRVDTVDGYGVWSRTYDQPGNGLFAPEESIVHEIIDPLPPGVALDAACGTGRHSAYLAARGHQVIGVDSSPDMLDRARVRLPEAQFRLGQLDRIPMPDDHVDLVVCALALSHVPDLGPVINEFARVLRPGGHLVISDVPPEYLSLVSPPHVRIGDGRPGLLPAYGHRASDYLTAALPLGLRVRRCEEPLRKEPIHPADDLGPWDDWPWSLLGIVPEAAEAAWSGLRSLVVWHFQLAGR